MMVRKSSTRDTVDEWIAEYDTLFGEWCGTESSDLEKYGFNLSVRGTDVWNFVFYRYDNNAGCVTLSVQPCQYATDLFLTYMRFNHFSGGPCSVHNMFCKTNSTYVAC